VPLDEIGHATVAQLRASLVEKNLSDKRINNILAVLSKALRYAEEAEVVGDVPRVRLFRVEKPEIEAWSFDEYGRLLGAAKTHEPVSAWLVAVLLAAALFGFAPRQANASWAALAMFFLIEQLGPLLQLPAWAMDVSPFAHVPKLPGAALATAPIVGLCGVAAALTGVGLVGFRRRDVG